MAEGGARLAATGHLVSCADTAVLSPYRLIVLDEACQLPGTFAIRQ